MQIQKILMMAVLMAPGLLVFVMAYSFSNDPPQGLGEMLLGISTSIVLLMPASVTLLYINNGALARKLGLEKRSLTTAKAE